MKRFYALFMTILIISISVMPVSATSASSDSSGGILFMQKDFINGSGEPDTVYYFLETDGVTLYPIYSDGSAYSSKENNRIIGFFLVSSSSVTGTFSTCGLTDSGEYDFEHKKSYSFTCTGKMPDYKTSALYGSYYQPYLAQFDINDDNYQDFYDTCKTNYYGVIDLASGVYDSSTDSFTEQNCEHSLSIYPLNPDGSKYSDDSISTLKSQKITTLNFVDFIPFLYAQKWNPEPDSPNPDPPLPIDKRFVCYKETVCYWSGVGMTYKNNFTWDVSEYPEFSDSFIEVRACPFLQTVKNDSSNVEIDWFYFCSQDKSKVKSIQKDLPSVSFSSGIVTGYKSSLNSYYYNWFQRGLTDISNSGYNEAYYWQVRVTDSDGIPLSDWCTFNQNSIGSSSIFTDSNNVFTDDDGNIIGSIKDSESYNPDLDYSDNVIDDTNNTSNVDDNIDPNDDKANLSSFFSWVRYMVDGIGDFPNLFSKVYGWLPSELISAIACSIAFIVVIRILGR